MKNYTTYLVELGLIFSLTGLILVLKFIFQTLKRSNPTQNNFFLILKTLLFFAVFPIYAFLYQIKSLKQTKINFSVTKFFLKIVSLILIFFVILPVWIALYFGGIYIARERLNLVEDTIYIAGTGSMYPTFPKGNGKTIKEQTEEIVSTPGMQRYPSGINLFGRDFFAYQIKKGDIISFFNQKTAEISQKDGGQATGFVKRVVATAGDKVEIRDGIFILNGQQQKEAYTAKAHSTFGGEFLPDCNQIIVPVSKVFVMGDNRKGSDDSRFELGLVDIKDIDHVIPFEKQLNSLDKNWRDTSEDLNPSTKIKLDRQSYLKLLNEERVKAGSKPLTYQSKLEQSASSRGKVMLKFDDLSFEATKSGYTMKQAMADAGYSNITWGEAPSLGYYEADELLENQLAFADSKQFLLNDDYQEVGIGEVEGLINGCPAQIIVQQFAGYVPPNYDAQTIEGWETTLNKLKEIAPGWEGLKDYGKFYQDNEIDIDRLNQIINLRINNLQQVVNKMKSNQWLTAAEQKTLEDDQSLGEEQNNLAHKLNNL